MSNKEFGMKSGTYSVDQDGKLIPLASEEYMNEFNIIGTTVITDSTGRGNYSPDYKSLHVDVPYREVIITSSNKTEAMRFDDNKIRFDLIPTEAIIEIARVYSVGALKYADNNWRKGMKFSRCIASLERHWNKWKAGESVDKDTGCLHLAQVAWNAMTLLVYCITKTGTDDRSTKLELDENFNWVDNHLSIGLSQEKLQELKDKYKQQRENAK